jgi:hypothetical protein
MAKYLKISNPKASTFYDPVTGIDLAPGKVAKVKDRDLTASTIVTEALKNGYLKIVDEDEFENADENMQQDLTSKPADKKKAPEKIIEDEEEEEEEVEEEEISESEMVVYLEDAGLTKKDQEKLDKGITGDKLKALYDKYKAKE